jgi:hypothetical protein
VKYVKADEVLPTELLLELQKYVPSGLLYISTPKEKHKKWGEATGSRKIIANRNIQIKQRFKAGEGIEELSSSFYLSVESIKKIVYRK